MVDAGFVYCYQTQSKRCDEEGMTQHIKILLVLLAILPTGVSAQEGHLGTAQQQRACRADVLRLCRTLQNKDDFAMANCLKAHVAKLSPACRQALALSDR
jgi:hypothetical protein